MIALALQQRVRGHLLDDIVIYGERPPHELSTEFQVKRTLRASPANKDFVDLLTQSLHVLDDKQQAVARGDIGLGAVAGKYASDMDQLAELAGRAAAHASMRTFAESLAKDAIDEKYRNRLKNIREAIVLAQRQGAPRLGGADAATHTFLRHLHVWRPQADESGRDFLEALDRIAPLAADFALSPRSLFEHLAGLAQTWGPMAGVVDADTVLRHLRRRGLKSGSTSASPNASDYIDVDAIVRGPLESLNLRSAASEAKRLFIAGDPLAPAAYADLANRLREANFAPHAELMLSGQVEALNASGQTDEAIRLSVDLAWDHLDRVRPWEAHFVLPTDLDRKGSTAVVNEESRRVLSAADAAVWVAKGGDLDIYVPKFDALLADDYNKVRAAVFLCEEAIAESRLDIVRERAVVLESLVNRSSSIMDEQLRVLVVRLQMCLADVSGEWEDLVRQVHRAQPRRVLAWLYARYARYLALSGDGAGSQHFYLEAIERASAEKLFDEAADWLYALRTVRFWFDVSAGDPQHPIAQALRPHAKPSALPGSPHTSELALKVAHDYDRPHEAVQMAQRWRWQAYVRAQLTDELHAEKILGVLLEQQGDALGAASCYIRSGDAKRAKSAANSFPEEPAHVSSSIHVAVPTSRAAAYAVVATVSDLLTDEDVKLWADKALEEISQDVEGFRSIDPSPYVYAFDLLESVADVLDDHRAMRAIQQIESLFATPTARLRQADRQVVNTLLSFAERGHEIALTLLVQPLLTDQRMAELICVGIKRGKRLCGAAESSSVLGRS